MHIPFGRVAAIRNPKSVRRFSASDIPAVCGMLAPFVFWLGVIFIGWLQPDYNLLADTVSKMGRVGRPYAGVANGVLVLTGLMLALFAWSLPQPSERRATQYLMTGFGLFGLAGAGLFPCDELCAGTSLANVLHTIPVAVGFICLQFALLLFAGQMRSESSWTGIREMALTLFQAGPFASAFFILGRWGIAPSFEDYAGLSEKAYLAILFAFIFILAKRLSLRPRGIVA